jgi:hypothetical protein
MTREGIGDWGGTSTVAVTTGGSGFGTSGGRVNFLSKPSDRGVRPMRRRELEKEQSNRQMYKFIVALRLGSISK